MDGRLSSAYNEQTHLLGGEQDFEWNLAVSNLNCAIQGPRKSPRRRKLEVGEETKGPEPPLPRPLRDLPPYIAQESELHWLT